MQVAREDLDHMVSLFSKSMAERPGSILPEILFSVHWLTGIMFYRLARARTTSASSTAAVHLSADVEDKVMHHLQKITRQFDGGNEEYEFEAREIVDACKHFQDICAQYYAAFKSELKQQEDAVCRDYFHLAGEGCKSLWVDIISDSMPVTATRQKKTELFQALSCMETLGHPVWLDVITVNRHAVNDDHQMDIPTLRYLAIRIACLQVVYMRQDKERLVRLNQMDTMVSLSATEATLLRSEWWTFGVDLSELEISAYSSYGIADIKRLVQECMGKGYTVPYVFRDWISNLVSEKKEIFDWDIEWVYIRYLFSQPEEESESASVRGSTVSACETKLGRAEFLKQCVKAANPMPPLRVRFNDTVSVAEELDVSGEVEISPPPTPTPTPHDMENDGEMEQQQQQQQQDDNMQIDEEQEEEEEHGSSTGETLVAIDRVPFDGEIEQDVPMLDDEDIYVQQEEEEEREPAAPAVHDQATRADSDMVDPTSLESRLIVFQTLVVENTEFIKEEIMELLFHCSSGAFAEQIRITRLPKPFAASRVVSDSCASLARTPSSRLGVFVADEECITVKAKLEQFFAKCELVFYRHFCKTFKKAIRTHNIALLATLLHAPDLPSYASRDVLDILTAHVTLGDLPESCDFPWPAHKLCFRLDRLFLSLHVLLLRLVQEVVLANNAFTVEEDIQAILAKPAADRTEDENALIEEDDDLLVWSIITEANLPAVLSDICKFIQQLGFSMRATYHQVSKEAACQDQKS